VGFFAQKNKWVVTFGWPPPNKVPKNLASFENESSMLVHRQAEYVLLISQEAQIFRYQLESYS
jgi:hypothetical protein